MSDFTPLPAGAVVFRLTSRTGPFVRTGQLLPTPDWLQPNDEDRKYAIEHQRGSAGVSSWDVERTNLEQARALGPESTRSADSLAFKASVDRLREICTGSAQDVDVVRDPLNRPDPGADGHSLIEGLQRTPGAPRKPHFRFLERVVELFAPHSDT